MRGTAIALALLALASGPALGQDYVDVEAERRASEPSTSDPYDPYRVQPAQAYPSTSYGVGTNPQAAPASAGEQNIE